MMIITPKHDIHTLQSLSTPSCSCQPGVAVRFCVVWQPGHPRAPCNLQGLGGCCFRIKMAGYSTKVCAQQARFVVSKVEEPEEEEEKCSEEKIRFVGHPRPTAQLNQQVLVLQWKERSDFAEQQQRRE